MPHHLAYIETALPGRCRRTPDDIGTAAKPSRPVTLGFALLPMIEPHVRGSDCNLGHIRCAGNQQIVEVTDHAKAEKSQRWMMKL
jgi:hypothetical protein